MSYLGWWDGELRQDAWFDAELQPAGWWDTEIINTEAGGVDEEEPQSAYFIHRARRRSNR